MGTVIGILFLAAVVVIVGATSLKIVRQQEKGVLEHLGRYRATLEPGMRFVIPVLQQVRRVDVREKVIDVPPQEVITKDNVVVTVDAVIYFQITDPRKVLYNIDNFGLATQKLAQTNLRNVVGDLELDATLTSREKINTELRMVLDEATDGWGVRITRVEIQKIDPPRDITEAMSSQMKAERERRARVLEATGIKEAAVLRAEGQKQSDILKAECEATATRQRAEAERDKRIAEPRAKPKRSRRCSTRSMTDARRRTYSRSSTSKPWHRWRMGRPPRSSCRSRPVGSSAAWLRWPKPSRKAPPRRG